ncbi:LysR substrate-binding domain-containing protein [Tardiphaga robiniae]|uniref:LysR substrate-binding domain-containing protein n=1 Tax=Tardiphaga robiniae TaxID=943830 RepID=A0A7G6U1D6_9BRAD|nr:LysR substrate-binding domain-containing protein [Tardiphaga robiniae]QND72818.1 hypothetical protein HB776_17490 [Tardiphaga robiniae]
MGMTVGEDSARVAHNDLAFAMDLDDFPAALGGGGMVLSEIHSIYEMTLSWMRAAILPDFLIQQDLNEGRLVPAVRAIALEPRPIVLVWPSHRVNLSRIRTLRECLEQELPGGP